jgi:hypothetical protein
VSARPAPVNLDGGRDQAAPIRRGDDYTHSFTFVDAAGAPISKAAPITWRAQLRTTTSAAAATVSFTVVVSGVSNNIVTISLTEVQTAAIPAGKYVWDLEETNAGTVITRIAGVAVVERDVSR